MRAARPDGGGSLGAALGEGLAAGVLNFTAAKDAEADKKAMAAQQALYERNLDALVRDGDLDRPTAVALKGLGFQKGSEEFAKAGLDIMRERAKLHKLSESEKLYDAKGNIIAENLKPEEPFDIAKLTGDTRDVLYMMGRSPLDPDSFGAPLGTEEEKQRFMQLFNMNAKAKKAETNVSVNAGDKGPQAAWEVQWKTAMESIGTEFTEEIKPIRNRVDIYDNILSQVESGDYFSGSLSELRTKAASFGRMLGMPVDVNKITNTQTLVSELRNVVLSRLHELDARPTDKDMEVLMEAAGREDLTPEALLTIFRRARQRAANAVTDYSNRLDALDQSFEEQGSPYRVIQFYRVDPVSPSKEQKEQRARWLPQGFED